MQSAGIQLEPLAVPRGVGALAALPRLRRALAGGAPVAPHPADEPPPALPDTSQRSLPPDLALVVGTSGSTGDPKRTMLGATALTSSAHATHERLGGPGQWLLALPAAHIAGLQVLLRSLLAGTAPVAMDLADGFTAAAFAAASARLDTSVRRYTALVPTQAARLLEDPAGAAALREFHAVLVGGAALPPTLRDRAAQAGVTLVATYGMSETAGGCVYDGTALGGTTLRVEDTGRISLSGPTLAHGYLGAPELTRAAFTTDSVGTRWFRTDDAGHLDAHGLLHVSGRLDDLVVTGGLKVSPRVVEEALLAHVPGVREAAVVGTPDPQWGQAVSALVVASGPAPTLAEVRRLLRGVLPAHALPRRLVATDAIPYRGPGKPDRRAVATRFHVG